MAVNSSTWAQESPTEITITAEPLRQVSGFDGVPLHKLPLNVSVIGNATLRDMGAQRVSEVCS